MAYEHTPDAAQILDRRVRFTDMFEKIKVGGRGERCRWNMLRQNGTSGA